MVDFLGQSLVDGDAIVYYGNTSHRPWMRIGVVKNFTKKGLTFYNREKLWRWKPEGQERELEYYLVTTSGYDCANAVLIDPYFYTTEVFELLDLIAQEASNAG